MVEEEDGFVRAIAAAITDPLPRLAFADWLDERADPRADWLRVGCQLHELGPGDARRPALEARLRELWEAHRDGLAGWERRFALARIQRKVARIPAEGTPPTPNEPIKSPLYLNPALSEAQVAAFEAEHRVALPEEYRLFLLEVGDGGLGPGEGLTRLADAVDRSPTRDLGRPFPFSYRLEQEAWANFSAKWQNISAEEKMSYEDVPSHQPPEMEHAQPGVLYLSTPDDPWASVYLVITGEDRGLVWAFGHIHGGWASESPTWPEDEEPIGKPPRSFFRWYEDWLDAYLPKPAGG